MAVVAVKTNQIIKTGRPRETKEILAFVGAFPNFVSTGLRRNIG